MNHGYVFKKRKNRINNWCSERGEACLQGVEVANVIDGTVYQEWTLKALEAGFKSLSEITLAYLIENSCW